MERTHKLGLVLGFGILMLAGILLSDHFSKAHKNRELPSDLTAVPGPGIGSIREPEVAPLPPVREPKKEVTGGELDRGQGETRKVIFRGADEGEPLTGIDHSKPGELDPANWNPKGLKVSTGVEKTYALGQGDTLYAICKKNYNDGNLYPKLAAYNESVLNGKLTGIRKGTVITLPPKDVLMGEAVIAPAGIGVTPDDLAGKKPLETSPLPGDELPAVGAVKVYKVVEKDTGVRIAEKTLGNKTRWAEIAKLNPGVDPSRLKIGQELKVPAK